MQLLKQIIVQISIFHTVFITNTLLLFPFSNFLAQIAEKLLPIHKDEEQDVDDAGITKHHLDKRLLTTPATALNVVKKRYITFTYVVEKNLSRTKDLILTDSIEKAHKIIEKEKVYK